MLTTWLSNSLSADLSIHGYSQESSEIREWVSGRLEEQRLFWSCRWRLPVSRQITLLSIAGTSKDYTDIVGNVWNLFI